jgi:predicted DNA-binding transcriptional regulator AlpA
MRDDPLLAPPAQAPPKLLLDARAAAEALSISARSLWSLTQPRGPIPSVRIGRSVRYDPRDLREFIDARKK